MMALAEMSALLAAAAPGTPTQADPRATSMFNMGMLAVMVVIMYLVLWRPQQKKAREHADMLKTIRNGDKVVTTSGIVGTIVGIKEKSVSIRSADTKLEVLKSAVSEITERSTSEA
jgi:preprotein translocase subunit YajC